MSWDKNRLLDFNARKIQLVLLDWSNNNGASDVKMDESILEQKSFFKMLEVSFSFKLDKGSYIVSVCKNTSKKIGTLARSLKFLSPGVAVYLPYGLAWNPVVMSKLVFLAATTWKY